MRPCRNTNRDIPTQGSQASNIPRSIRGLPLFIATASYFNDILLSIAGWPFLRAFQRPADGSSSGQAIDFCTGLAGILPNGARYTNALPTATALPFPSVYSANQVTSGATRSGSEGMPGSFAYKPPVSHPTSVQGYILPCSGGPRRLSTNGAMVLEGDYWCNLVCTSVFGSRVLNFIKDFALLGNRVLRPRFSSVLHRLRRTACDHPVLTAGSRFPRRDWCAGLVPGPMRGRIPPHRWRAIRRGREEPRRPRRTPGGGPRL